MAKYGPNRPIFKCLIGRCSTKQSMLHNSTDGLFENEVRGGGGGLTNKKIAEMLNATTADPQTVAKELIAAAVKGGSTDDITVQVLKL